MTISCGRPAIVVTAGTEFHCTHIKVDENLNVMM